MNIRDYRELLDFATKALAAVTTEMRVETIEVPKEVDRLIIYNLCLTTKDSNFCEEDYKEAIRNTLDVKNELIEKIAAKKLIPQDALWEPKSEDEYEEKLVEMRRKEFENVSAHALREIIMSGVKGVATFAFYAYRIGFEDEGLNPFIQRVLQRTLKFNLSIGLLFNLSMELGGFGYRAMALLEQAAQESYGVPKIANVELSVRKNPAILVSGMNLKDLENILAQTEGEGVDVYTHGDMISAHAYPGLASFDHFAGNWGTIEADQEKDFENFPGPVVYTGSGLKAPLDSYKDRLFTTGFTKYPGVKAIDSKEAGDVDFSEVVAMAKKSPAPQSDRLGELLAGFAHDQLESMMELISGAVKDKSISRIIAIMGNDSNDDNDGEYFTNFVREMPLNSAIMTAGTVKYRFNYRSLGTVHGVPRILDAGSVADAYSIASFVLKLQSELELYELNKVPVSFLCTLNDEKSIIAFLSLIYIGARNIFVGPSIPAWLSPDVMEIFSKNFDVAVLEDPQEDCEGIFSGRKIKGDGPIDPNMLIVDIIERHPQAADILMNCGMSCVTCGAALYESLAEACAVHGLDPEDVKDVLDHELGLVEDDD